MKAVLLAAGTGNRLKPITNSLPKQMIKIAGKPLLEYILDDLVQAGFDDICIVVGFEADKIIKYFNNWNKNLANITFVIQNELHGTAHAVNFAKDFVGDNNFLLYLSDTLIPYGLSNLLDKMTNDDSDISILSSQIFNNETHSVGNITISENYVKKISEKTQDFKSDLAWAGLAFFKDNSIFELINDLELSKHGEYDITEAMELALLKNKKIKNFNCKKFIDCGTLKGLLDGLTFILSEKFNNSKTLPFKIPDSCYVGENCVFGENVIINPYVSIDENCRIGDNVHLSNCILLENSVIENNKSIINMVVSGNQILNDCS